MSEQDKANKDLIQYGQSFTVGGKHIPLDEVILSKSEQDRIAFDALNRLIEQDHKVPQGSMTLGIISERLNHRYKTGFIDGYKEATTEANKRIAELEGEVAELKSEVKVLDQLYKDACESAYNFGELQAHINTLREACKDALKLIPSAMRTHHVLKQALEATPAESLQAHDDEVIEKCAKVCDEDAKQSREFAEPFAARCAELLAEAIRALKGK